MSYPYPQDRHRDRREKGEQPYEDAREAFAETEAEIERNAPGPRRRQRAGTDEEQAEDAEQRFERIGKDVAERQGGDGS